MRWGNRKPHPEPADLLAESEADRGEVDDVVRKLRKQVATLRKVTAQLEQVAEHKMGGLSAE
jgi:hypothetical protein